jgi:outer membrane receptor protein involved in Fe transport
MQTGAFNVGIMRRLRRLALLAAITKPALLNAQVFLGDASPTPELAPSSNPVVIVVTGSRIPRPNLTAVSPVIAVDREEARLQGAVLTEDLLNSLPQVVPDQGAFLSNGATGTATVDLRGLGPSRTLVLLNGRRLLPGDPFYPVPDINAVPTALIKRVELLTGGASSVYGSDAVAGVVNFILESDLKGLRLEGQASFFQHDNRDGSGLKQALIRRQFGVPEGYKVDGGAQDINGAYGTSFGHGRGHATIYAGYRKLSPVTQDARDYSACAAQGRLESDVFDCGGSTTSARGTFFTRFSDIVGPLQVGSGRDFVVGLTRFNFAPFNYFQRPGVRYTAGGFAQFEFGQAAVPFVEAMFMDDRTKTRIAPSGSFGDTFTINCDNPLLSNQQWSMVCFPGNFVGEVPVFDDDGNLVDVLGAPRPFVDPVTGATYFRAILVPFRRNVEGGPRISDVRHKNLRLLLGMRGELGRGITYETSFLFGRVKLVSAGSNDLSNARIGRALDVIVDPATGRPACRSALTGEDPACVPWDIFAPGAVSSDATSYLAISANQHGTVKQRVATAFSNLGLGEWGIRSPLADGGPSLSIGAEYRKDDLDFWPDAVLASGDIAGQDLAIRPVAGSTEVKELFAETRIPLVEDRIIRSLVIEAGYRQSWQSNSESRFRVNSYKLGVDFALVRDLRVRASLQRAVRAPNVQDLFAPVFPGGFGTDPCAGVTPQATAAQCALTGVTPDQYGHVVASPNLDAFPYNAIFGGNPALKPEKATTKALGVVLRPSFIPGLNATFDWFNISIKDAISVIGPTRTITTCIETGDPLFCSLIHRDGSGSLWMTSNGFVDSRNANIGSFKARGIDVGANYTKSMGRLGSVNLGFLGSWLDRLTSNAGGLATSTECAGAYGLGCGTPKPKWRHKVRATWTVEPFALSLQWRHFGSVRLDRSIPGNLNIWGPWRPGDERIRTQNYFDLTALAQVSKRFELRFGVRNLLDREPPIVSSTGNVPQGACPLNVCSGNTFPQVYDPLGRYLFAGFTANF